MTSNPRHSQYAGHQITHYFWTHEPANFASKSLEKFRFVETVRPSSLTNDIATLLIGKDSMATFYNNPKIKYE